MLYFPLTRDTFEMAMNAQAGVESLIAIETEKYRAEIDLKNEILATDRDYYYHCPVSAMPFAWEALEIVLNDLATHQPQHFSLETNGAEWIWTNHLLDSTTRFLFREDASLPLPPLDWLGRQVQEDLILMAMQPDGDTVCVAGHLCFGSAWCLGDKIGQSFLRIHDPVPEFRERIGAPSDLLMRRLKVERPVSRLNWSITSTDQLNLAPALAAEWHPSRYAITPENAGERVFFRIEFQTLTRLPQTGGILFTIHTYVTPLSEVVEDPASLRRLTAVMRDFPETMKDYKGMHPYYPALMRYLETRLAGVSPI